MTNDLNAEAAVLSAVLNDPRSISRVVSLLPKEEMFYNTKHRKIYRAILDLYSENVNIDIITVADRMRRNRDVGKTNILLDLDAISDVVLSSYNVDDHIKIVIDCYKTRKYREMAARMEKASQTHSGEKLMKIAMEYEFLERLGVTDGAKDLANVIQDDINELNSLKESNKGRDLGIKYRMGLDDHMRLINGELYFIGARPAMGKTSFGVKLAYNVAITGRTVYYDTLETSKTQINHKIISITQKISDIDFKMMSLTEQIRRQEELRKTLELYSARLIVDDKSYSLQKMIAEARHISRTTGLDLIVLDHLTLMSIEGFRESRVAEVTRMTRSLKLLAMELNIPIVILVQLNRSLEVRDDKRPRLSDLRESGSIEQDAGGVIFLYRPEVYGITVENGEPTEGLAEIIIAKNRYGAIGKKKAFFHKDSTNFIDWSQKDVFLNELYAEQDEEFAF